MSTVLSRYHEALRASGLATRAATKGPEELLVRSPRFPLDASEIADDQTTWLGLRVASRVLGQEVWLARTEADAKALETELAAECTPALVFTVAEVIAMEGMLAADMRTLARIKRFLPGSRIESVARQVKAGAQPFAGPGEE